MATFGNTTAEGSTGTLSQNILGLVATSGAAGQVKSITAYLDGGGSEKAVFAIYDASDDSLLGTTNWVYAPATAGWVTADFPIPVSVDASSNYYLLANANGSFAVTIARASESSAGRFVAHTYDGTMPDPSGTANNNFRYSIYATYEEATDIKIDDVWTAQETSTVEITVASNSDKGLAIAIGTHQSGNASGITANGDAMTLIKRQTGSFGEHADVWFLVNPDTGTYDVVVSGASGYWGMCIYSLYNVDQNNPSNFDGASSGGSSASVTLTDVVAGSWLIDAVGSEPDITNNNSNSVWEMDDEDPSNSYQNSASSRKHSAAGGSVTMSYSLSYGGRSNIAAMEIEKAPDSTNDTDNRDAKLTGEATATDNRDAMVTGNQSATDNRDAHIYAEDTATENRDAIITGTQTDTDNRDAKTTGNTSDTDNRGAKTTGEATATDNRGGITTGNVATSDNRDSKVSGVDSSTSSRNLKTTGQDTDTDNRNATMDAVEGTTDNRGGHIYAEDTINSNRSAKTVGEDTATSNRDAKTTGVAGATDNRDAHMYATDTDTDNRNAITTGSESDTDNRDLKLTGVNGATSNRSGHMYAFDTALDSILAKLRGEEDDTDNRDCILTGTSSDTDSRLAHIYSELGVTDNRDCVLDGSVVVTSSRGARIVGKITKSKPTILGEGFVGSVIGSQKGGTPIKGPTPTIL